MSVFAAIEKLDSSSKLLEIAKNMDGRSMDVSALDKPLSINNNADSMIKESSAAAENRPAPQLSSEGIKSEVDDNGKPYKINGNLEENCEYTVNGYDYKTDENGRIIEASGKLYLSGEARQPLNEQGVGGIDRRETDDRGHLIADRFGGSNKMENLVPQDSNLNRGAFKSIENECANALKEGKEVSLKVEVDYERDSRRPCSFTVTYTINGETYEKTLLNERQGN